MKRDVIDMDHKILVRSKRFDTTLEVYRDIGMHEVIALLVKYTDVHACMLPLFYKFDVIYEYDDIWYFGNDPDATTSDFTVWHGRKKIDVVPEMCMFIDLEIEINGRDAYLYDSGEHGTLVSYDGSIDGRNEHAGLIAMGFKKIKFLVSDDGHMPPLSLEAMMDGRDILEAACS